jgi:hypothetical protein
MIQRSPLGNNNNQDSPVRGTAVEECALEDFINLGSIVFTEPIKRGPVPFDFLTLSSIPDISKSASHHDHCSDYSGGKSLQICDDSLPKYTD